MANRFSVEVAIDAYHAQHNQIDKIGAWSDGLSYQYGSERFHTKDQLVYWLKQQKPDVNGIAAFIQQNRQRGENPELEGIFRQYESYYGQIQQINANTQNTLQNLAGSTRTDIMPTSPEGIAEYSRAMLHSGGKSILELQNILQKQGFYTGTPTALYDQQTIDAVKLFQSKQPALKNNVNGIIDAKTFSLVFGIPAPTIQPQIAPQMAMPTQRQPLQNPQKYVDSRAPRSDLPNSQKPAPLPINTNVAKSGNEERKAETPVTAPAAQNTAENAPTSTTEVSAEQLIKYENIAKTTLSRYGWTLTELQTELKIQGFYTGTPNGKYDQKTFEAVKAFQLYNNIKDDGIFGAETANTFFETEQPEQKQ